MTKITIRFFLILAIKSLSNNLIIKEISSIFTFDNNFIAKIQNYEKYGWTNSYRK